MCMYCWFCVNSVYVLIFLIASAKFQPTDTKILSWASFIYVIFIKAYSSLQSEKFPIILFAYLLFVFKIFLLILSERRYNDNGYSQIIWRSREVSSSAISSRWKNESLELSVVVLVWHIFLGSLTFVSMGEVVNWTTSDERKKGFGLFCILFLKT